MLSMVSSPPKLLILYNSCKVVGTHAAIRVASRPIQRTTDCSWSITSAREWFEECQQSHPRCRMIGSKPCPKRIIYIGENDKDAQPSLLTSPPSDVQYAALSYCWGS